MYRGDGQARLPITWLGRISRPSSGLRPCIIIINSSGARATGGSCGHKLQPGMKSRTTDQAPQGASRTAPGSSSGGRAGAGRGQTGAHADSGASPHNTSEPEGTAQAQAKPITSAKTSGRQRGEGCEPASGRGQPNASTRPHPAILSGANHTERVPGGDTSATPHRERAGRGQKHEPSRGEPRQGRGGYFYVPLFPKQGRHD